MATPNEKLASALKALQKAYNSSRAIKSSALDREHRELLSNSGYLTPIINGWYMQSRPGEEAGSSTQWYASMKDFISAYCEDRFKKRWHVSPEYSLSLHTGASIAPKQVVIFCPSGNNTLVTLPENHSILSYKTKIDIDDIELINKIRVLKLGVALTRVSEAYFKNYAADAHIALSMIKDVSEVLMPLLKDGKTVVAGRLAGAYRSLGKPDFSKTILSTMRSAGYKSIESNPFESTLPALDYTREFSPYATRVKLMWSGMRQDVIEVFGDVEPDPPKNIAECMQKIEDNYVNDAYHSLSIEGYEVTDELIERVRVGIWSPDDREEDTQSRNALAARGYYLAHNVVKNSIEDVLNGKISAGAAFRRDHSVWYRELFAPSVQAGLLKPEHLAGYRNHQVFIRNAEHVPPQKEAVRDMMPVLSELLESEPSAAVRAVLGHFIFVFIHPYMDGNGRTARFAMNAMLVTGGYPWTIIEVEGRKEYMASLNDASARANIKPFAQHIYQCMLKSSVK